MATIKTRYAAGKLIAKYQPTIQAIIDQTMLLKSLPKAPGDAFYYCGNNGPRPLLSNGMGICDLGSVTISALARIRLVPTKPPTR